MSWKVECTNNCRENGYSTSNILDLLDNYRDQESGWFLCRCGERGYVRKEYALQEKGEIWKPILKGAIRLGDEESTYQPFVFFVVNNQNDVLGDIIDDVWFCYYKDTRPDGGSLKLGHGPGGPPVLGQESIGRLYEFLFGLGYLD